MFIIMVNSPTFQDVGSFEYPGLPSLEYRAFRIPLLLLMLSCKCLGLLPISYDIVRSFLLAPQFRYLWGQRPQSAFRYFGCVDSFCNFLLVIVDCMQWAVTVYWYIFTFSFLCSLLPFYFFLCVSDIIGWAYLVKVRWPALCTVHVRRVPSEV